MDESKQQALYEVGQLVADTAKLNLTANGNVDTGMLRDSIRWWFEDDNTVVIGSNLEYAPYVEMGTGLFAVNGDGRKNVPWKYQDSNGEWHTTSGMQPHPYLQPALDACKPMIKEMLKNYVVEGGYGKHKYSIRG